MDNYLHWPRVSIMRVSATLLLGFVGLLLPSITAAAVEEDYPEAVEVIDRFEASRFLNGLGTSVSPGVEGSVVVVNGQVPARLRHPGAADRASAGLVPLRVVTPAASSDWGVFEFEAGTVRVRLVGRNGVEALMGGGAGRAQFLIDDLGVIQHFVAGAYGYEEFLEVDSGRLPGGYVAPISLSYELILPEGWTVSATNEDVAIFTPDGWIALAISAPWVQSDSGDLGTPEISWDPASSRVTFSVDPVAEDLTGKLLLDPSWESLGGSTYGAGDFQYKYCYDSTAVLQCEVESSETPSSEWTEVASSGASDKFEWLFVPSTTFRIRAKQGQTIGNGAWGMWRYTPPTSNLEGARIRVVGYQQDPPGQFTCYVRGVYVGGSVVHNSATPTGAFDIAVTRSPANGSGGVQFTKMDFYLKNEGSSYTWNGSGQSPSCYAKNGGFVNVVLNDISPPSKPVIVDWPAWVTPGGTFNVTYDADDLGSGLYQHQSFRNTWLQTEALNNECDPAAAEYDAQPCPLTQDNATISVITPVEGSYTDLKVRVRDFGGQQSVYSDPVAFGVDGTNPVTPSISSWNIEYGSVPWEVSGQWSGSDALSGIDHYDYCISQNSGGSNCDSGAEAVWASNGGSTNLDVDDLALSGMNTYYLCIRSTDNAGNESSIACSSGVQPDPDPPVFANSVQDGIGSDVDFQSSGTEIAANWSAATDSGSGILHYRYDYCAVSICSTLPSSPNTTEENISITGQTLTNGTSYYFCVQAEDNAGNLSEIRCSDGIEPDFGPSGLPNLPDAVLDGSGVDVDIQYSSTQIEANWTEATDTGSGVQHYRYNYCANSDCNDLSGAATTTNEFASFSSQALANGTIYYFCVQAMDNMDNLSGIQCSDGVEVEVDLLPPTSVSDLSASDYDYNSDSSAFSVFWTGDGGLSFDHWEVCVSSVVECGGTPEINWTDVGTVTNKSFSGLTLSEDTTYFSSVRSADSGSEISSIAFSDGVFVDEVFDDMEYTIPLTKSVLSTTLGDIKGRVDVSIDRDWVNEEVTVDIDTLSLGGSFGTNTNGYDICLFFTDGNMIFSNTANPDEWSCWHFSHGSLPTQSESFTIALDNEVNQPYSGIWNVGALVNQCVTLSAGQCSSTSGGSWFPRWSGWASRQQYRQTPRFTSFSGPNNPTTDTDAIFSWSVVPLANMKCGFSTVGLSSCNSGTAINGAPLSPGNYGAFIVAEEEAPVNAGKISMKFHFWTVQ